MLDYANTSKHLSYLIIEMDGKSHGQNPITLCVSKYPSPQERLNMHLSELLIQCPNCHDLV